MNAVLEGVQELLGDDWQEIAADPKQLNACYELIMIGAMRHRGEIPPHYTATTTCKHCGPVPIFEGLDDAVLGCPWCFNRLEGLPMPGGDV